MANPTLLVIPTNAISGFPTVPYGLNRVAILEVNYFRTNAGNVTVPTTITVGGVAGAYYSGDAPGTTQDRAALTAWSFTESQIAAISGGAVSITGGTLGTQTRAVGYVVQDTRQGGVSNQAMARVSTGGLSIPLTRVAESLTIFAGFVEIAESVTTANPAWVSLIGNVNFAYAADTARTANTTTQSKSYRQTGHVINFEPTPAQTITSVNGGEGVKIGSTGNTAQTSGFTTTPNTVAIATTACAITDWNAGTGVITFDGPDVTHAAVFPDIDSTQTFTVSSATETASLVGVPLAPPTGSTVVIVASPNNVDPRALGYWMISLLGVTPVNGDKYYGVDADTTWQADLYGDTASELPLVTPVVYWDASTGLAYLLNVTVSADGVEEAEWIGYTAPTFTTFGFTPFKLELL